MSPVRAKAVQVKICGITNPEDAVWAANLGADFVGLNFSSLSPRKVSVDMGKEIAGKLPPFVKCVGVFVNPTVEDIEKVLKKISLFAVQLHGDEKRGDMENIKSRFNVQVWKAVRVQNEDSLASIEGFKGAVDRILLDAWVDGQQGGTGKTFDWALVQKAKACGIPLMLAGGLNPENVQDAVETAEPDGIDAASGVEKDGHPRRKDIEKMKLFISRAKS